jgi:hypothetical protein
MARSNFNVVYALAMLMLAIGQCANAAVVTVNWQKKGGIRASLPRGGKRALNTSSRTLMASLMQISSLYYATNALSMSFTATCGCFDGPIPYDDPCLNTFPTIQNIYLRRRCAPKTWYGLPGAEKP